MKATIEFNLPEEEEAFNIFVQASEMSSSLWEISQYLRQLDKYGHSFTSIEEAISQIRQRFIEEIAGLKEMP